MLRKEILVDIINKFKDINNSKIIKKINVGLINDTYLITNKNNKSFVLQKLNSLVFNKPKNIIFNILKVSNHLEKKINKNTKFNKTYLRLFKSVDNKYYYNEGKNFWRLTNYIENSRVYNNAKNCKIVYEAAGAFSEFVLLLFDLDTKAFKQPVLNFNNYNKKYLDLLDSAKKDTFLKLKELEYELDFIKEYSYVFKEIKNLKKELPLRLIHNDTKLNNVLFDKITNKALCVIDLDTVNSSYIMYDFGDLFRSINSPKPEDEIKINNVKVNLKNTDALFYAYSSVIKRYILKIEKETLINGIKIISLSLAARFLNDYLNNSVYFKTTYEKQNLYRAKMQIALFKDILKNENNLYKLVKKYFY